ncbi:MAG: hypothetical protein EOO04_02100, partial [Chitinophagaceae bacterium]
METVVYIRSTKRIHLVSTSLSKNGKTFVMKTTMIKYLAVVLAVTGVSCTKNVLDQVPPASISPNTFFKTEGDLKAYTNLFYNNLPDADFIYGEDADNIVKSSVDREIAGTRLVPTTDGRWSWSQLRDINFFLNSENVQNFTDQNIRDEYVGLARFFRALFYFEKVKSYGDVPWYSTVIETNDEANLMKARDSRVLIMDSVLADIDFAIAHLKTTKSIE